MCGDSIIVNFQGIMALSGITAFKSSDIFPISETLRTILEKNVIEHEYCLSLLVIVLKPFLEGLEWIYLY